jgi:RNA polymerase sigma-32 factor
MARTATLPVLNGESGLSRYLAEIRKFPMLEPQQEYMLAKRWREHDDRDAAHQLVTSHLRLVAKIAMGYRGYGLPISEVVSEGNVGLMQAVKRFEPDKGFRLATYAMWWIKASIQEYILRSWSLVKMGTTANQKKLFFNLRKAKSKISALDEGDLHPDQVKLIAKRLGVTDQDVIDMNRRLGGDASLNAPIRDDGEAGEWQDWLVDNSPNQEAIMAEHEEFDHRRQALTGAIGVLNPRERRIFEARRQDVIDMNRRLGGDASLNAPIRDDGEAGEWQDWLVDTAPNQEAIMAEHEEFDHRREALNGAIGVLNPRERRIFEARRLAEDPMTLEDLAAEFGVSRERVRQIEVRAFEKVQSAVKGTIARQEQAALEAAH